jgi:hypothetical protein
MIRVKLRDGERVGGLFEPGSNASFYPEAQDLYLEQAWRLDRDGQFIEPMEGSAGLLVRREDIEVLEFLTVRTERGEHRCRRQVNRPPRRPRCPGLATAAATRAANSARADHPSERTCRRRSGRAKGVRQVGSSSAPGGGPMTSLHSQVTELSPIIRALALGPDRRVMLCSIVPLGTFIRHVPNLATPPPPTLLAGPGLLILLTTTLPA